jgi:energy-coupling factor transport system permease protein
MILALAFRFVPSLVEESKRILNAQASRGVDFTNGNYADKMKSMSSLLIPIFSIGFIKSNDLANAMEARSYFPEIVGTKYRQYVFSKNDLIYSIIFGILTGIIIMLSIDHVVFGPLGIVDIQLFHNR